MRALVSPGGGSVFLVAGTDAGIWRVAVAGRSWTRVDGAAVNCMTVDSGGVLYAGTPIGVLRSTDAGANWSDFNAGLVPGTGIVAMTVGDAGVFAAVAGGGVVAFFDGADHWVDASVGLGAEIVNVLGAESGSLPIAGTEAGHEFVFNAGSWQASANPASNHPVLALYSPAGVPTYTGTRDFGIYVNGASAGLPANTSAYAFLRFGGADYAGTNHHVYRSANAGATWTQIATPVPDGTPITSFATVGGALYAGTAGFGVLTSSAGTTWSSDGPADARVNALFESPGATLLAGTTRGIQVSTDAGVRWSVASLDSGSIACFVEQGGTLFAGTLGQGVARSTDGGATWTDASTGLPAGAGVFRLVSDGTAIFANLVADPTGLYRSLDGGDTWTPVTTITNHQNVTDLTVLGGRIFAGEFGATGGVFASVDHGDTWTPVNGGVLGGKTVTALGAGGGAVYAATTDGMFRSDDDGASWQPTQAPALLAKEIAVHGDQVAVAETDGTVLRTKDAGRHWERQTTVAQALAVAAGGARFFLGTDAGAWTSDY